MRRAALTFAAVFLAATFAAPQMPTAHPGAPAQHPSPGPAVSQRRFFYYKTPRSSLDTLVHDVPPTNAARLAVLQDLFVQIDCSGPRLRTQPVEEKHHQTAQNLICTWPSSSPDSVVVVAHYTLHGKGASALDDWSGAALLPALCLALQIQARHNTWIFLESAGARGDAEFLKSLSPSVKAHIRAVISLDALGLDPTLRFFTPSDTHDPSLADVHLQIELLASSLIDPRGAAPQLVSPQQWLSDDDTQPFRYNEIPDLLLHSVPADKGGWPGSNKDLPTAIDANAYYDNYRAIAVFLIALDPDASMLSVADEKFWGARPGYHLNPDDLPYIH